MNDRINTQCIVIKNGTKILEYGLNGPPHLLKTCFLRYPKLRGQK